MGTLFVGIVCNNYTTEDAIENVIRYALVKEKSKKKVRYYGSRGVPSDVQGAKDKMVRLQRFFGKDGGRRIYQMTVSFPEYFKNPGLIKDIADEIADYLFRNQARGYQLVYGIHEDTDNLHIHFGISSVNYITAKKWHTNWDDLDKIRNDILKKVNKIITKYGYSRLSLKKGEEQWEVQG